MSDIEDVAAEVHRRLDEIDKLGADVELKLGWDTQADLAVTCVVVVRELRAAVRSQRAAGPSDTVAWLQAQERFKEILDPLPERVLGTLVISLSAELSDADDRIAELEDTLAGML